MELANKTIIITSASSGIGASAALLFASEGAEVVDVLNFISGLHPMKRMAGPKEIAQAALFLLSDRPSFMTGSPKLVDGGISVHLTRRLAFCRQRNCSPGAACPMHSRLFPVQRVRA
jgi:NAD(P)-dependent dehydrogenase (short-subunit alcohol dehydrogenase family)